MNRHSLAGSIGLLLVVWMLSTPLAAQSTPEPGSAIARWVDSLSHVTDREALVSQLDLLRSRGACRDESDPTGLSLRYAFGSRRVGDLSGDQDPIDAALECFSRLVVHTPDLAIAWYGLGLTRLSRARAGYIARPGPAEPLGSSDARGATEAFIRALTLDSTLSPAAIMLPRALALLPQWMPYKQARNALRRTAGTTAEKIPSVLLARAEYERETGERDSTMALLQRYLAAGGDSARGYLELAGERYARGDVAGGEAAYRMGARHVPSDRVGRSIYRANLAWVADTAELQTFDTLRPSRLPEWIMNFWSRRDLAEGRPPGARLREHFRRYEYAEKNFRLPRKLRIGLVQPDLLTRDVTPLSADAETSDLERDPEVRLGALSAPWSIPPRGDFDARGVVYLRLGPPDNRAGNWWAYYRSDGDLYLQVVPTIAALPGNLCDLAPRYCRPPATMTRELTHDAVVAQTTDNSGMHYHEQLRPIVQMYATVDPGVGSGLLAVFALPSDGLSAVARDSGGSQAMYPIHFRLAAALPSGGGRQDADTLRHFVVDHPLTVGERLVGTMDLPVPPGRYNVRLTIEEPDSAGYQPAGYEPEQTGTRGAVVGLDGIQVPPARSDSLAMSDVILGREGSGLVWVAPDGAAVPLNPLNAYPPSGTVALYYQLIGLRSGTQYETTIALARADDEKKQTLVSLRSTERATRNWMAVRRQLELPRLKPGHYRLMVTVKPAGSGTGRAVSRSGTVNVVDE